MNGIVLIDKPAGCTSFKITSTVRAKLNVKKAGHAGTLDPMATGVLPVMIGQATKIIDFLPSNKKRYLAGFQLGMTTTTLDVEGEVLSSQPCRISKDDFKSILPGFLGAISQIPPMYSAVKQNGVKLYDLARKGIQVERKPREVFIYSIDLIEFDGTRGLLDVRCSKGTYVRTLIDDMGRKLLCGACMTSLIRTESNGFTISQCVSLDDFLSDPNKAVKDVDFALNDFSCINVTQAQAKRFLNGGFLSLERVKIPDNAQGEYSEFRICSDDKLIGLGVIADECINPKIVFTD